MKKVFLGGTCNNSTWRDQLIPMLKIDYFNPIVDDWTKEAQQEEIKQRKICDFVLYVITPKMKGVYSIAELIDDSNKCPEKTIFCFLYKDENDIFTESELKSLIQVGKIAKRNGATYCSSLIKVAEFLNKQL